MADEGGELLVRLLLGAVALKKVEGGEAVQVIKSAGRESLRLLHVAREVLHERGSLTIGGGDNVNEEADKKGRKGEVNENDADESAQTEAHREFDHWFEQEGKDGRDRNGCEDGLEEGDCADDE